jgi:transcriptional regulator GlxA family with amidase domain
VYEEVTRVRLATAKRLLVSSDAAVLDVAIRSGFANVETLYRVFRCDVGITPTEYRKKFSPRASKDG